jgi:hypothetical protein
MVHNSLGVFAVLFLASNRNYCYDGYISSPITIGVSCDHSERQS